MLERVLKAWLWLGAALLVVSVSGLLLRQPRPLTDFFFVFQDLPILAVILAPVVVLRLTPGLSPHFAKVFQSLTTSMPINSLAPPRSSLVLIGCLSVLVALVSWAGVYFVYDNYALSLDEFMATFGAAIHQHGALMAPVKPQWQDYAWALQPQFAFISEDGAFWTSCYLPVNAAIRGLAGVLGEPALSNPLLLAVSTIAIWGIGRRIWPERPAIAWIAALFLATSSQALVTAMTPYAMTAHLAFNLVWLWLFLRGGRLGYGGSILVGFLACGIHQLVFHPLFVGPFVLQLWLERRWRLASFYTLAYAVICLFWIEYWPIALNASGGASTTTHPASAAVGGFGAETAGLVAAFDPAAIGLMAKNLIRFVTWQNPLTAPLALLSLIAAFRAKGTLRSLALGIPATTFAMFILLPYQGHGWGYRYLQGQLGSVCLLAAWEWTRLTDRLAPTEQQVAKGAFVAMTAASLLVLFPIRALQVHNLVDPYARADAMIRGAGTQVVLVDDTGSWFTIDLVRNDPYLRNRPLLLSLGDLEKGQLQDLCSRYTISIFDPASAASFGIRTMRPAPTDARLHDVKGLRCGADAEPIKEIRA